jgi:hypothetical protein
MKTKYINKKNNQYKKLQKYGNTKINKVFKKKSLIGKPKRKTIILKGGNNDTLQKVLSGNPWTILSQSIKHPIYSVITASLANDLNKMNNDKDIFNLILKQRNDYLLFMIKQVLDPIIKPLLTDSNDIKILYDIIKILIIQFKIFIKKILDNNITITIDNNFINNIFNLDEANLIKFIEMDNTIIQSTLGFNLYGIILKLNLQNDAEVIKAEIKNLLNFLNQKNIKILDLLNRFKTILQINHQPGAAKQIPAPLTPQQQQAQLQEKQRQLQQQQSPLPQPQPQPQQQQLQKPWR